ncbi:MAG: outer membrane beta-barrel protein [Spirochaetaceae bacterium]|jgi:TolB-like protein|nr:outer membrane beta-barrel protein [Spirochaetaceae bacterium]
MKAPENHGLSKDEAYLLRSVHSALVEDFIRNSGLEVFDRDNVGKVVKETENPLYQDDAGKRAGDFTHDYMLEGELVKTSHDFLLSLRVTDTKTKMPIASRAESFSFEELKDKRSIYKVSSELIKQMKKKIRRNAGPEDWKNKRLYIGARAGLAAQTPVINTNRDDINAEAATGFEAALQFEYRFFEFSVMKLPLRFFAQSEIIFSGEKIAAVLPEGDSVTMEAGILNVPLLAKAAWTPRIFYFAVFAGPALTLPLGQMMIKQDGLERQYDFSPTFGLLAGINAGIKVGQGAVFLDARYYGDCLFTRVNDVQQYRRQTFSVSLGYRYGFLLTGEKR